MAGRDSQAGPRPEDYRAVLCDMLIDKIRRDPYPSPTMMDLVESQIGEDQLPDYLDVLVDKLDGDRFPSMDMIRRISALTG